VKTGIVKVYYYNEEKDKVFIQDFCFPETAVIPYYSFVYNKDDDMIAETLEASELYYIKQDKLLELYQEYPELQNLKMEMLAYDYHRQQIRLQHSVFYTIEERYAKMLEVNHPIAALPNKEIAEYFEISPQHFCRIKKNIFSHLSEKAKYNLHKLNIINTLRH
jgi:CRP-like cAMP-binding protein